MSDDTDDFPLQLDLREQLVRIDRELAEAAMLRAETYKFMAEAANLRTKTVHMRRWEAWKALAALVASSAAMLGAAIGLARLIH